MYQVCDVSSLKSVMTLAADFQASSEPLHLLVNNAGVMVGNKPQRYTDLLESSKELHGFGGEPLWARPCTMLLIHACITVSNQPVSLDWQYLPVLQPLLSGWLAKVMRPAKGFQISRMSPQLRSLFVAFKVSQ